MHKKLGFSLIEILVAVAIIGLLATIVVPNLRRSKAKDASDKFISELNSLTGFALQNAIKTKKMHQIFFNFAAGKRDVSVNIATEKDKYGKDQYVPVTKAYTKTNIKMTDNLELKNFYVGNKDEAGKLLYGKGGDVYFFVGDGICQAIVINYLLAEDKYDRKKKELGLVLNPFCAQFEAFNEFKKP